MFRGLEKWWIQISWNLFFFLKKEMMPRLAVSVEWAGKGRWEMGPTELGGATKGFILLYGLGKERAHTSLGWLWTQNVAKFYFQLLIFLSLPVKFWDYRHGLVYLVLCHVGHQTQGFGHAKQTLYLMRNPSPNICVLAAENKIKSTINRLELTGIQAPASQH